MPVLGPQRVLGGWVVWLVAVTLAFASLFPGA